MRSTSEIVSAAAALVSLGACGYEAAPVVIDVAGYFDLADPADGARDLARVNGVSDVDASVFDEGLLIHATWSVDDGDGVAGSPASATIIELSLDLDAGPGWVSGVHRDLDAGEGEVIAVLRYRDGDGAPVSEQRVDRATATVEVDLVDTGQRFTRGTFTLEPPPGGRYAWIAGAWSPHEPPAEIAARVSGDNRDPISPPGEEPRACDTPDATCPERPAHDPRACDPRRQSCPGEDDDGRDAETSGGCDGGGVPSGTGDGCSSGGSSSSGCSGDGGGSSSGCSGDGGGSSGCSGEGTEAAASGCEGGGSAASGCAGDGAGAAASGCEGASGAGSGCSGGAAPDGDEPGPAEGWEHASTSNAVTYARSDRTGRCSAGESKPRQRRRVTGPITDRMLLELSPIYALWWIGRRRRAFAPSC